MDELYKEDQHCDNVKSQDQLANADDFTKKVSAQRVKHILSNTNFILWINFAKINLILCLKGRLISRLACFKRFSCSNRKI